MTNDLQEGTDRPTVAGEGNIGVLVVGEDIIEEALQTSFLRRIGFPHVWLPQRVGLCEIRLKGEGREGGVDVGFAAAAVAGVDAYSLAEKLEKRVVSNP